MARWFPLPPKIRTILVPTPVDDSEVTGDKVRFDLRERFNRFREATSIGVGVVEKFRTTSTEALVLLVQTVEPWLPRESTRVDVIAAVTERLDRIRESIFIGLRSFATFKAKVSDAVGLSVREVARPRETTVTAAIITESTSQFVTSEAVAPRVFETVGARDNDIFLAPRTFEPVRFNVLDRVDALAQVEAYLRAMAHDSVGVRVFEKFPGGPITLSMFLEMDPTASGAVGDPFFYPETVVSFSNMSGTANLLGHTGPGAVATANSSGLGGLTSNTVNWNAVVSFRDLVAVDALDLFTDITRFRVHMTSSASSTGIAVGASSSIDGDYSLNNGSTWTNWLARASGGLDGNISADNGPANLLITPSWAQIQQFRMRAIGHVTSGTGVGASCSANINRFGFNLDAERLNF
jgi:hypothetical protein